MTEEITCCGRTFTGWWAWRHGWVHRQMQRRTTPERRGEVFQAAVQDGMSWPGRG